jgi:hypothetical protein
MIFLKLDSPLNAPHLYTNAIVFPHVQFILRNQCVISSFGSALTFHGAPPQPIHFDHPQFFESTEACREIPASKRNAPTYQFATLNGPLL